MMNEGKLEWHMPQFQLLDARATAQTSDPGSGGDHFLADPNLEGDLPETSETQSLLGAPHAQADAS
jgi:hypothetical protein